MELMFYWEGANKINKYTMCQVLIGTRKKHKAETGAGGGEGGGLIFIGDLYTFAFQGRISFAHPG